MDLGAVGSVKCLGDEAGKSWFTPSRNLSSELRPLELDVRCCEFDCSNSFRAFKALGNDVNEGGGI